MADARDIETLVRAVTERVLARTQGAAVQLAVEPGATEARRRRLVLLLAAPSGHLKALAAQVERLIRAGWPVQTLTCEAAQAEIEQMGLRTRFGPEVQSLAEAGVSQVLGKLGAGDLVVLGTLGFAFARRLRELDDDDPFVRLCAQALLGGVRVAAIKDDLSPVGIGPQGPLGQRAEGLLGDLAGLGIDLLPGAELPDWLEGLAAADVTLSKVVGSLLTESDVEQIAASGERRLVLPDRCIVTPLAWSRAADLGLALLFAGSD